MELTLDKAKHEYRVGGIPVPSVTDLTRFLSHEVYGSVPPQMLRQAGRKGSAVHDSINELESTGSTDIRSDCTAYLRAYNAFLNEHNVICIAAECSVNRGTDYAGTFDRLATVDGSAALYEITVASSIGPKLRALYSARLNLYRMAAERRFGRITRLFVLQLRENGSYTIHELPPEEELPLACLCLHRALKPDSKKGIMQ